MPATQCAVWDLNPRLAAYEAAALTTELTALVAAAAAYSSNRLNCLFSCFISSSMSSISKPYPIAARYVVPLNEFVKALCVLYSVFLQNVSCVLCCWRSKNILCVKCSLYSPVAVLSCWCSHFHYDYIPFAFSSYSLSYYYCLTE